MIRNGKPENTEQGLKKVLSWIPVDGAVRAGARWVTYFAAVATIYVIAGGDTTVIAAASPVLARLIESIGPDTLAATLSKVANSDEEKISTEDISHLIKAAFADNEITSVQVQREFNRAIRLLQQQNNARFQELSHHFLQILDTLQRLHPGDPAPLSLIPKTSRHRPSNTPLIGREHDLSWLHRTVGDRLLIGQPGVGKTSLLFQLAIRENGYFAVSIERGELGAALIEKAPSVVIVDDAHRTPDFLLDLRQLRDKLEVEFDIVASTWPSSSEIVAENLNVGVSKQHELALLTRDEIVAVVKGAGLLGPDQLIREIVDQAVGRPGLAQTLTLLCLDNNVQDLFSGEALRRSVVKVLDDLRLPRSTRLVLATLSFAGDAGMLIRDAAQLLELRTADMWGVIDGLSSSGIVYDTAENRISVRPAALREALVVDVFYDGSSPITLAQVVEKIPDLITDTALTLVGARFRGGSIPDWTLTEILEAASSVDAWRQYAGLGRGESQWILSHHPELITSTPYPLLYHVPDVAIPLLLERADNDERLFNTTGHPLRFIENWINSARPGTGETVVRRKKLLQAALDWLASGKDTRVGFQTLQHVMSPRFRFTRSDPGSGKTARMHFGTLTVVELLEIKNLWAEIRPILSLPQGAEWKPFKHFVEDWAYPSRATGGRSVAEEVYELMRSGAGQMLVDIAEVSGSQPGLQHWVMKVADSLGVDIEVDPPTEFLILYPHRQLGDWEGAEREQRARADALARQWCKEDPDLVVQKAAAIEMEARNSELLDPRWTRYVFKTISDETASTTPWLDAFAEIETSSDMLLPFLSKAKDSDEKGWMEKALAFLENPVYRAVPVQIALGMEQPPQELLDRVLEHLPSFTQTVQIMCLRREVPETTLKHLLQHDKPEVARAAAWGEWNAEPKREVRQSVERKWRDVVIQCVEDNYWLRDIFTHNGALAFLWLQNVLMDRDFYFLGMEKTIQAGIDAISVEQRGQLLFSLDPDWLEAADFASRLVGDDLNLYKTLLSSEKFQELHLSPLTGELNHYWISKARMASDMGYTTDEIAGTLFPAFFTWSGNLSDMWQGWVEEFEQLCNDEDDRIQQIGLIGRRRAITRRDQALAREREEDVFGR